jgi:hypothetical protein
MCKSSKSNINTAHALLQPHEYSFDLLNKHIITDYIKRFNKTTNHFYRQDEQPQGSRKLHLRQGVWYVLARSVQLTIGNGFSLQIADLASPTTGAAHKSSKEANKEVAKNPNVPVGTRYVLPGSAP